MVAVHLYQPLSDKYGAKHEFFVSSPREAVEALDANFPGFRRDFMACGEVWLVVDGDLRNAVEHGPEFAVLPASGEIHFVPKVEGNAFLGAALVGWAFGIAATSLTAQIVGTALVLGVSIGLSLLFRKKVPTTKDDADDGKLESYAFTGPENVVTQGAAVPLVYGRCYCGSVVVSAGLELGSDLTPYVPPAAPAASEGAAGYPTGTHGYVPTPPGGFPPIIAQSIQVFHPPFYPYYGPYYTTETKFGPQGYVYIGVVAVTTQQVVNVTENVDYWRGPQIHGTGFSDNPYAARFYAYDRVYGFSVFDQQLIN
jgi:predicted phage tail protein